APILLFITGVLAGLIAGFILSRLFSKGRSGDASGEARLLEERLLKADQGTSPAKKNQSDRRHAWVLKQPAHTRSIQALWLRSSCEGRRRRQRGNALRRPSQDHGPTRPQPACCVPGGPGDAALRQENHWHL
ncbi:MAG: hypothetical protein EBZ29_12835, partial [Synechococcaceae bacterium WB9_4xC_028]|nr:hypothetical protein [Synechococcaceae bacterium WB9_4xC_028]